MELISFSVQNYRSIAKANRIEVGRSTVLVGPNNEGKSNVLRALVTAMEVLKTGKRPVVSKGIRVRLPFSLRGGRQYDWEEDFPIHLQKSKPDGVSTFSLEFELDGDEVEEFRTEVRSNLNALLDLAVTHELGHAICHDQDERRADDYGRGLREKKPVACGKRAGIGAARASTRK